MDLALIGKVAGIAMLLSIVAWVYNHGKKVESLEGQSTTNAIVIEKAKQNAEISVNRPDFDALVDGVWGSGNY